MIQMSSLLNIWLDVKPALGATVLLGEPLPLLNNGQIMAALRKGTIDQLTIEQLLIA
jgi:hypothetical protein